MATPAPPPDAFAFSPDGELFAVVADRQVQVWSTTGGQKIAEWTDPVAAQDDLYSCIACSSVQKKKKDGNLIVVAVGTANGEVLALDSTGIIWRSTFHTGKVISLHFSKQGHVLYTASMDGVICELETRTGKSKDTFKASKKSISYLTISHDEKFMGVSGKTTKLFNVKNKKDVLKIPSEDGPIQLMSVSDDARILVSCDEKNKEVQVWSCDHHNGTINSTASLVMHTQPKAVECKTSTSCEAGGIVLAVSRKGVAYVWHLLTISQDKVQPTKISVKNAVDKKGRIPIILAKLCDVKEDNTVKVHVAFGSPGCLQFKVVVFGENHEDINLVAESDALASENVGPQERNLEQDAKVNSTMAGEHDQQENTSPTDQGSSRKRTASVLDSTSEHLDTVKEGNPDYNLDEPTMEQKLESLNLLNKSEFLEEQSVSLAPPSADSVHILLKQALRADDHAELLKCLYNRDEKVIVKSVSLLTPADALKLLKFFVSSIQSRGSKLVCLLPWLQTLLSRHMSTIVSQESSLLLLNSLYQLIDARTSTFKAALKLSTILDYQFSEIADDETDEEEEAAPIIYEDKDTDDEEESDADAMETDGESEELGAVTDVFEHSDGSEIMSD